MAKIREVRLTSSRRIVLAAKMDRLPESPELLVVLPVFNEQETVGGVIADWFAALSCTLRRFTLLAIDDGSTDATPAVLEKLRERFGARLEILHQSNRGHGQSCVAGYRVAALRNVPWIFQCDSDGQCDPRYFAQIWQLRDEHDVIYGRRTHRDDGWTRVLASRVVRALLRVGFGVNCVDANTPYRLMRTSVVAPFLPKIPADFSLANIALAVLLRRAPAVREASVPIRFRARAGGAPKVAMTRFAFKAIELSRQLQRLSRDDNAAHASPEASPQPASN